MFVVELHARAHVADPRGQLRSRFVRGPQPIERGDVVVLTQQPFVLGRRERVRTQRDDVARGVHRLDVQTDLAGVARRTRNPRPAVGEAEVRRRAGRQLERGRVAGPLHDSDGGRVPGTLAQTYQTQQRTSQYELLPADTPVHGSESFARRGAQPAFRRDERRVGYVTGVEQPDGDGHRSKVTTPTVFRKLAE